jgi:hypothetical protein
MKNYQKLALYLALLASSVTLILTGHDAWAVIFMLLMFAVK